MDLRVQLDAAHRRIAELEKELETYRKMQNLSPISGLTTNSTVQTTVFKSSVITRAAAAALKQSKLTSAGETPSPTVSRPRAKQTLNKKIAPSTAIPCTPLQLKAHPQNAGQSAESITFENSIAKMDAKSRSKSMPKILRPAIVHHQRFSPSPSAVPLKPKLAIEKAKRPGMHTNILSPVSTFSDGSSSPTMSTSSKKTEACKTKEKCHPPSLPIGKSSKKERSTIVAKCTEPRQGQTRYWTQDEHERFLEAVAQYGEKAYVAISNYVETRTPKQVRTHAQKFQMKMARLARQSAEAGEPMQLPPGMLPIAVDIEPKKKVIVTSPMTDAMETELEGENFEDEQETQASEDLVLTSSESCDIGSAHCSEVGEQYGQVGDVMAESASSVSDVSGDDLTDPYLSYIGGDAERHEDGVLEDCFAAKMNMSAKNEILSLAEVVDIKTGRGNGEDDDLEDLGLDCGELPMASLCNFGI